MLNRNRAIFLLVFGIIVGIFATIGFNHTIHATSTETFCISCHEMENFVYKESLELPHKKNHAGVEANCADCHVPKEFLPKMKRKIMAAREVWHHMLGTLDTPEKFEQHRLKLAERVWEEMEANDSRACRHCHNAEAMDFASQSDTAAQVHPAALKSGMTCINCHKGIAHKLPTM